MSLAVQIGALVRQARERKGLTQLQVANRLGYESMQFVSLFERGLSKVPYQVLGQLIIILEISEASLKRTIVADFKARLDADIAAGKRKAGGA